MVCTHTLYNEVWAGSLDLSVTELPEAMKRKQHKDSKSREHKKNFGTDISQRPEIAALRIEEGHWEGDTVVGKRAGKEAVVLSLLEKKTENYIAIRIPGKDADSVLNAMQSLREEFGDKFSQVFKTIKVVMVSDTLILVIVCFFYGFAHHIFSKEVAFIICCAISESINSTTHKWGC